MLPPYSASDSTPPKAPENFGPPALVPQWGSSGESRIDEQDRDTVYDAVKACDPMEYRSLFPIHGAFGALSLGPDGLTLWLYTAGGAYIVGEMVNPETARPKSVPASGSVNISSLSPDLQDAVMKLLKGASR